MAPTSTTPAAEKRNGSGFPAAAWADIHVEAPGILPLPLESTSGVLHVTIVNGSLTPLNTSELGPLTLNYRLFDADGKSLGDILAGASVTGTIPPGECQHRDLQIEIPTHLNNRAASARVGLGRPNGKRVNRFYRYQARTVLFDRGKCLTRLQEVMLEGARIWPLGRSNGLRWPSSAMMVAERHKLLYIPVAKCACTSLKAAMLELAGIEHHEKAIDLGVHLVTDRFNTGVQLKDKSMKQAWEILASPDYFKFMVVREPFERLVSAYLEKFVYNRHNERNLLHTRQVIERVQGSRSIDLQQGISFNDFASAVVSSQELDLDPHWRPQYLYRKTVKHHISTYKLENIEKLAAALGNITGRSLQLEHRNRTRKSSERLSNVDSLPAGEVEKLGSLDPRSFESTALRHAISQYYEKDLELYLSAE
jgi:hypothetical protein